MKFEKTLMFAPFRLGFLLLFICNFSAAQHPLIAYYNGVLKLEEQQVDSLVKATLDNSRSSYLLALAKYQEGVLLRKHGMDIEAFKSYDVSLDHLNKADTSDIYLESALWRNRGAILHNYKLYEEAVGYYNQAIQSSYAYKNSRGFSTEYNIALSTMQFDPEKALKLLVELEEKVGSSALWKARVYIQLGLHEKRTGQFEQALVYYRKALSQNVSGRIHGDILQNISEVYHQMEDYIQQENFLLEVMKISKANHFIALMDLGECYILQNKEGDALRVLAEAELLYKEQRLKRDHIQLFELLKQVSAQPMKYAEKQIDEQAKYIERMDVLKEMIETSSLRSVLIAIEAEKKQEKKAKFYQILAYSGGLSALLILLTWRLWWFRLRRNIGKTLHELSK